MKIIHLSDTHLGYKDSTVRMSAIVTRILNTFDPSDTVVVHTGDLLEDYNECYSDMGRVAFNRLHNSGFKVLLCPGNHDYGNAVSLKSTWARYFRIKFARELYQDALAHPFPVVTVIKDTTFIGLDTSECELGFFTRFMAEGNVGPSQRAALHEKIVWAKTQGLKVVVYLHHHPFINGYSVCPDIGDANLLFKLLKWATRSLRRLKDAYSLMQVCRDRVDIMLFGHIHNGLDHRFEAERYGIKVALDGSSSTAKDMEVSSMRIRVIDTDTFAVSVMEVPFPV